jgi:membrane protease YdiL (CAAX protease family)
MSDLSRDHRPVLYILQLQLQWLLFLIMVLGLFAAGTRFKDLVGRRWRTQSDFLRDLGLGLVLVIAQIVVAVIIVSLIWPAHRQPKDPLDPRTMTDLLGFIPIALTAGFSEEAIFRGYLQRQFHALTGSPLVAIIVQAAIFSLAHGYTLPAYDLIAKFISGLLFGAMAFYRKSLLPGMLAHAAQDCLVGVVSVAIS